MALEHAAIELARAGAGHRHHDLDAATEEELREAVDEAGEGVTAEDVETVLGSVGEEATTTKGGNVLTRYLYRATDGAALYPLPCCSASTWSTSSTAPPSACSPPEIRDHFGLDTSGILTVVSLSLVAALLLGAADRLLRRPAASGCRSRDGRHRSGASSRCSPAWPPSIWVLGIARAGSGLGRAVNDPVHNSLIADYYDIPSRPRVYAIHRYANAARPVPRPAGRPA